MTLLALPLAAAITLHATPLSMGFLTAIELLPWLLFGVPVGQWVDRSSKRTLIILADVTRGVLLLSVPILAIRGQLSIDYLYIVAFSVGVGSVFFEVAYQSFLPEILPESKLVVANSRLEVTATIAQLSGPGLAGVLVQILTAPVTLLVDSLSYFWAAICVGLIRRETVRGAQGAEADEFRGMWGGLRFLLRDPVLRSLAAFSGAWNLGNNIVLAAYILYALRVLHVSPALLGGLLTVGSAAAVLSALVARPVIDRLGLGRTLTVAAFGISIADVAVPLIATPSWAAIGLLALAQLMFGLFSAVYRVASVSLRQTVAPRESLGRISAAILFVSWGTIPIGASLGGLLGTSIGLRMTIVCGVIVQLMAFLFILFSPTRRYGETSDRLLAAR